VSRAKLLTKQAGEFGVAAELGRRGVVATTFSGNMPGFDILGMRADSSQIRVQVKATRAPVDSWFCGDSECFFEIGINEGQECILSQRAPHAADFFWVFVLIGTKHSDDEFFILSDVELVKVARQTYDDWLAGKAGRSITKNPVVLNTTNLAPYSDKWGEITANAVT